MMLQFNDWIGKELGRFRSCYKPMLNHMDYLSSIAYFKNTYVKTTAYFELRNENFDDTY
jgi:hypothetical protein